MANQRWSLDFLSDQLTDGRCFPILAVVDDCNRECLVLAADTSLTGLRVAREPTPSCIIAAPGKKRCRLHGGMSTGPKTPEGIERIREAQRRRWAWRHSSSDRTDAAQTFAHLSSAIADLANALRKSTGIPDWARL